MMEIDEEWTELATTFNDESLWHELDGRQFMALTQMRMTIFPSVKRSTLKTCMRRHGIQSQKAQDSVAVKLSEIYGKKQGGHYIISKDDVKRLIRENRGQRARSTLPAKLKGIC